jgi:glutathione-regulated potassium-efflux system protein KefB
MDAEGASILRDGVLLLGFGLACVLLFRRLGLGATLGYLVAGAIVGPFVLDLAGNAEAMIGVAELGIVFLLFIVGLELAPARLWRLKHLIFGLGLVQVVICGVALTGLVFLAGAYPLAAALALGLPLALSSTAQVLPLLQSSGRLRTPVGERAFAVLLFQDLSVIPLITIVAALSVRQVEDGPPAWQLVLLSVAAVFGLVAAGRFLLRPLFRLIGQLGEREMFIVAGLFTIIASAAVMEWLGLSTALGAFVAGVMLADTPYRHELEADIEPFRSILLGAFFLAVGMMLDLGAIARDPLFVVGVALALIAVKTLLIGGIGLIAGMDWRRALALGLLLSQGGEFGFVLFTQAQAGGVISSEAASLFSAIVTLSMATTPFLMMVTRNLRRDPVRTEERDGPRKDGARALVVGYGRFGQTVAQMLIKADIEVTLIDTDTELIDLAGEFGAKVYFGDGMRLDLLRQAGAGDVELICFCIDGEAPDADFIHAVKQAFPDAALFVRAFDRRSLIALRCAPTDYVVREVMESAVTMARAALERLGDSEEEIDRAEVEYRENDRERLDLQMRDGDLRAGRERTITQPERGER